MTTRDNLIEQAAKAILDKDGVTPDTEGEYWAQTWDYALRDAEAALTVFENAQPWEYSIAYPTRGAWDTDGAEVYETQSDAKQELEESEYLDSDCVVRRHPATAWEEIPNEGKE